MFFRRVFTKKFAIHVFELKKLNRFKKGAPMEEWLALINVGSKEELMAIIDSATIPEDLDAGRTLLDFQADERLRQEAWYREKQMRDEASQLDDAYEEGREEGTFKTLARLVSRGRLTISEAAEEFGMSVAEFEELMKSQAK